MSSNAKSIPPYGINVLAQVSILQSYGQIIAGFALPRMQTHEAVVDEIQRAASKLYAIFPRLAGQVVKLKSSSTIPGTFGIVPYPPSTSSSPVIIKDATHICPTWTTLVAAGAPMFMLPCEGLSKYKCWPHWMGESEEPKPVLVIQANFIRGGVIITFALQHQAGDGGGFAWAMHHFAALLRGEDISRELVDGAMSEKEDILPLLRPEEEASTLSFFDRTSLSPEILLSAASTTPRVEGETATWAIFRFTAASLARLKLEASKNLEDWISTGDALLALLWSRLSAVRVQLGMASTTISQCTRAVDMRTRCDPPLPKGYLGHSVLVSPVESSLGEVAKQPLSASARSLRQQLGKLDAHYLRTVASKYCASEPQYIIPLFESPISPAASLSMSSWAIFDVQKIDFGLLGKPHFCRRAGKLPLANTSYLMPKFENGDLDLQVCFLDSELVALKTDEVWSKYADWVG